MPTVIRVSHHEIFPKKKTTTRNHFNIQQIFSMQHNLVYRLYAVWMWSLQYRHRPSNKDIAYAISIPFIQYDVCTILSIHIAYSSSLNQQRYHPYLCTVWCTQHIVHYHCVRTLEE